MPRPAKPAVLPEPVTPEAAHATPGSHVFDVRFQVDGHPLNSYRLHGKGQLQVDGEQVQVHGLRHRLFRAGVPQALTFQREHILNVVRYDDAVSFELAAASGGGHLGCSLGSAEQAQRLVALLPQRQSAAFALQEDEQADFEQRLKTLSPRAPVTPALVALNLLVFVAMCLAGASVWSGDAGLAIQWGSNYGPAVLGGQWWRLLSSMFLHFGILHVALNMLALWQTGRLVERMYGSLHFGVLYLVAGVSGSLASLAWNPQVNSAGASGAIFGVYGGLLAYMSLRRNAVPATVVTAHLRINIAFVAFNLLYGFVHAGIDNASHIGGLLGGLAAGYLLGRPLLPQARRGVSPRIAVALVVAGVLLAGSSAYLAQHAETVQREVAFSRLTQHFAVQDASNVEQANALNDLMRTRQMPSANVARALEQDVAMMWNGLLTTLEQTRLPEGSRQQALRQQLLAYVDARWRSTLQRARAVRSGDPQLIAQANASAAKANALGKALGLQTVQEPLPLPGR